MYLLVMYDISNPKRLRKVAKILESYGVRVQKSIFELKCSNKQATELQKRLTKTINENDRIHYFNLCNKDLGARKADGLGCVYFIPNYAIVT